jgi:hypothetical protein
VRPHTGAANAKELAFDVLDSGYSVGTAGTKAVGRSRTLQLFHGSEVAFWPNAGDHFAGVMQAVPDLPGTEVILESTGHGVGGEFHERWQMAEAGIGDYEAIFVPWFWSDEYRREVPAGFVSTMKSSNAWSSMGCSSTKWCGAGPRYSSSRIQCCSSRNTRQRRRRLLSSPAMTKATCEGIGPLVIGADPARFGDDRFSVAWRRGRKLFKVESRQKIGTVEGANLLKQIIDVDNPARVFLDLGGVGAGTFDILQSWGPPYDTIVVGINFGGEPPLLLRGAGADQIADDHEPGGEPDADRQWFRRFYLADPLDESEPGPHRSLGVFLVRLRIAEIDQHAIAHILGDKPGKAADRLGDIPMIRADNLPQIFGIAAGGKLRRADEIAEHDRQLSPLGLCNGWNIRDQRDLSRSAALAQGGDRLKEPAAVADRGNAEIL